MSLDFFLSTVNGIPRTNVLQQKASNQNVNFLEVVSENSSFKSIRSGILCNLIHEKK